MPRSHARIINSRLPVKEAIRQFKISLSDDKLVAGGQFVWSQHYRSELFRAVDPLIDATDALRKAFRDGNDSLIQRLVQAVFDGDEPAASTHCRTALALPAMAGNSAEVRALRPFLLRGGSGGVTAYRVASEFLASGKPVRPRVDEEYEKSFPRNRLSFRGGAAIQRTAKVKCFAMVSAVCSFISKTGGLSMKPTPGLVNLQQVFEQRRFTRLGIRKFALPLGDLVGYGEILQKSVDGAKRELDAGKIINAQVVPGIDLNNPSITDPEHSVAIIAWERRDDPFPHTGFCFWDPDPVDTSGPGLERAFGFFFFEDGATAQARVSEGPHVGVRAADGSGVTYGPAFYKNGRLTTARLDSELGALGSRGNDSNNQHRYQVTAMLAF
jgi:hypothetical protein